MENSNVRIRIARPDDAQAIHDIYQYYVENSVVTFDYETPTVEEWEERIPRIEQNYPFLVATIDHKVVGYTYASQFREKAAYDWSVEVTIYLDPELRRQEIGTKLYFALEHFLKDMGYINANACITVLRATPGKQIVNESIRFHRHLGYREVGQFHKIGYKSGSWYEIVWMQKKISEHTENPPKVTPFAVWREENDL